MWIVYALMATVLFGLRGVLYQWTSQKNIDRNLLLFGAFLVGFSISAGAALTLGHQWYGWQDVLVGVTLGLCSFSANTMLHKAFASGKASLISVLVGLTPLFVLLLAYVLWHETLTAVQLVGFFVIFVGLYIIRYSNDISFANLQGAQWGLLAALLFSFTDLLGKQSTRLQADTFATLTLMFGVGSGLFALSWFIKHQRKREHADTEVAVLNPRWSVSKTIACGLLIGLTNVAGMVALISAFAIGNTGLVSAISGMNILIILLYSRVILKESFTRQEFIGLSLALLGVIVLRFSY